MRTDTLRKQLANNMANIVVNRLPETFIDIAPDINLTWTDRLYPGGVWAVDVGTLDVLKDNPEAQAWFKSSFKNKKPSSLRVAKAYVEHLLDDVLPEGATYHIKGHAIQSQNKPGTEFGKGTTGATKNELYQKWWGNKKGMQVLPDGSLMYQGHDIGAPVTRPPTSGAPNEYIEALSKEDWRMRKRLSPNSRIKNQYGEQWNVPREKWWKVEVAGDGGIEGRLKTKGLAYDNFKSGIRRAGIKGKTLQMSPWEWDAVYEAYKYAQKHGYHVDHIDPISKGGFHVWDNLQVLDAQDNLVKSAKTDIEGIVPKRSTYLVQGPLTEQDWVKYTKKNKILQEAGTLRHVGRGLSRNLSGADAALQFASGNYIGGGIGLAMQTPAFQKQIGKALTKTFAKSGASLLPGVGMTLSTLEAAGYATEGRWTQSGIAALSGVVGEVPLVGDLISAGLDLTNTGIDIVTGNLKPDLDEETLLRKVGRTRI